MNDRAGGSALYKARLKILSFVSLNILLRFSDNLNYSLEYKIVK